MATHSNSENRPLAIVSGTYSKKDMTRKNLVKISCAGFIDREKYPDEELEHTIEIKLNNIIGETYSISQFKKSDLPPKLLCSIPIPSRNDLISKPQFYLKINGEDIPIRFVERKELIEIVNKKKDFDNGFYSITQALGGDGDQIFFGYKMKGNSIAEIEVKLEFSSQEFVNTNDNFSFQLHYKLNNPIRDFVNRYFLHLKLPQGFRFQNISPSEHIVNKDIRESNNISYSFKTSKECPSEIVATYERDCTGFLNIMRSINRYHAVLLINQWC